MLGVQRGPEIDQGLVLKREAFTLITVTSSTKLICFRRKYQESLKMAENPPHWLIRLGHLEIHVYVRILAQCCVAIVSNVNPC